MTTSITSVIKARKNLITKVAALVFWLAVWELAAIKIGKELLVPAPISVLKSLLELSASPTFWKSVLLSLARVFLGFLAGAILGSIVGAVSYISAAANALLTPLIKMIRATPVASFILLALIWITSGLLPSFISMLMVLPVVSGNVYQGISETDPKLLEMGRVFRFGNKKIIKLIYFPSVKPYFYSACVTSLGLSWKAGIAAEVLCQPKLSVGTYLYYSKIYLDTPALFAWTAVVIILSMIVEQLLVSMMKKI